MTWEVVIGLETHAQLSTASKIFSGASTAFGAAPNTQASAVDLALPGVLPVLNAGAVVRAIRFGLAVGGTIAPRSVFARKNYFYPDLPKGYQISQYELPVVVGAVEIAHRRRTAPRSACASPARTSRRTRASRLHEDFHGMSGIDLEPGRHAAARDRERAGPALAQGGGRLREGAALARALDRHQRRQHAGGLLPLRRQHLAAPDGRAALGTRREIKNLNSFRFLEKAMNFEIARQAELLEDGGRVVQETRLWDPPSGRDALDASQGGRQRLPLLPRPGPAAPRDHPAGHRARAGRDAGAAGTS